MISNSLRNNRRKTIKGFSLRDREEHGFPRIHPQGPTQTNPPRVHRSSHFLYNQPILAPNKITITYVNAKNLIWIIYQMCWKQNNRKPALNHKNYKHLQHHIFTSPSRLMCQMSTLQRPKPHSPRPARQQVRRSQGEATGDGLSWRWWVVTGQWYTGLQGVTEEHENVSMIGDDWFDLCFFFTDVIQRPSEVVWSTASMQHRRASINGYILPGRWLIHKSMRIFFPGKWTDTNTFAKSYSQHQRWFKKTPTLSPSSAPAWASKTPRSPDSADVYRTRERHAESSQQQAPRVFMTSVGA